jgi:hypothetical protein
LLTIETIQRNSFMWSSLKLIRCIPFCCSLFVLLAFAGCSAFKSGAGVEKLSGSLVVVNYLDAIDTMRRDVLLKDVSVTLEKVSTGELLETQSVSGGAFQFPVNSTSKHLLREFRQRRGSGFQLCVKKPPFIAPVVLDQSRRYLGERAEPVGVIVYGALEGVLSFENADDAKNRVIIHLISSAVSRDTLRVSSFIPDDEGKSRWVFNYLQPGTYDVLFDAPNCHFQKIRNLRVQAAANALDGKNNLVTLKHWNSVEESRELSFMVPAPMDQPAHGENN